MQLPRHYTPRWIIFLTDALIVLLAFAMAYFIRFEFAPPWIEVELALAFLPWYLLIRLGSFLIGKTYAGIIRYTGTQDTRRIFITLLAGSFAFLALNLIRYRFGDGLFHLPNSVIVIEFLLSLSALVTMRLVVKFLHFELRGTGSPRKKILIYGAGEAGLIAKRTIDQDAASEMSMVGFVDDDPKKANKKIEGKTIYPASKLSEILEKEGVNELIISIQRLSREKKQEIVAVALTKGVKVLAVPPPKSWINGELSVYQIRNIRIDDLLGREPIRLDNANVLQYIKGRTGLVTGGAGSIGAELVRQIAHYAPARLVVFDQAESPLYDLQQELSRLGMDKDIDWVIGDVRQYDRVKRLFDHFRPQVVFHAAAYKHVPLMEDNPTEAVLANVLGTRNVADISDLFGVEKFVLISTDKAVNPTNVMGATKRVAEMYVQSKSRISKTAYVTTRFGNVLGSTGSVIPLFKKQIEEGGPITVTHEEVTRYFMTIPEAVQLVLEAGSMGQGGEIFVFDMGKSVKIIDLARQMIRLSGLEEGKDIRIEITGLRPGEKLYEELLSNAENTLPTNHPKILKARVAELDPEVVAGETEELISLFNAQNNERLVAMLKKMVPEYISQNSEFSSLDR